MSYEGFYIDKHSSCWVLHHDNYDHGVAAGKTKQSCLRYLARLLLERDQDILIEAYQAKMSDTGETYSRHDALDALIHEASMKSKHFIEVMRPELRKHFEGSGAPTYVVERAD